ncbi:GNAT family N-acetyltransferase [Azospirillum brasilense]|uniref:GNAT family N-acetyltransferase n=1 Tax=Azospirillum brasilense TaxID=192 RepID=A0A6L3AR36_AZOBR|nr:GNAT family N-acetyltransferase [Azospirillum brasilense]KAA0676467.1 GNAT family N-acetyltransferase [Azospirillum brasilense]
MTAPPAFEVLPFDPHSAPPELWAERHVFRRARHAQSGADDLPPSDAWFEAIERQPSAFGRNVHWVARAEGRIVGIVGAFLPNPDQPDIQVALPHLHADGFVLKEWRRRGIGRRLLAEIHGLMVVHGKIMLTLVTDDADGHAFLGAIGAEERLRSVDSRLALDGVDWAMVEGWHAAMRRALPGLTETIHAGEVPDAEFEAILPLHNALLPDLPRDRLDQPLIPVTMAMVLEWKRNIRFQQVEHHMVVLRDADGSMIGFSDVFWHPEMTDRVHQIVTGVRRDRRGLGVGKGLKAALLRHVRSARPSVQLMITRNAATNGPMLAINRRLGYAEHTILRTHQIDVAALGAALAR